MKLELAEKTLFKGDISDLESKLGFNFPESLTEFYLKNNGGIPTHKYYNEFNIQVFYSIKYGDEDDTILKNYQELHESNPGYRKSLVPFGHDGGGWTLCIDLSDENYGEIFTLAWSDGGELYPVSSNFYSFINGLKEGDTF